MPDPENEIVEDPTDEEADELLEKNLAIENQRTRAQGMAILAAMPEFWKERFREVARVHYGTRRGRRATAKLLREYGSWLARTAQLRASQAESRDERREAIANRTAKRLALGKPPLRGVIVVLPPLELEADSHP